MAVSDSSVDRAFSSLVGTSIGDAFGECFFSPDAMERVADRPIPRAPWYWTDDTEMACSVFDVVRRCREIDQDELARCFAERQSMNRGYGAAMYELLQDLRLGVSWADAAPALFGGGGSFGNGSAMRVAPLGAYFADDPARVVVEAKRSAVVTHAHAEATAGAIAVAVAAATFARHPGERLPPPLVFGEVLDHTPPSWVARGIEAAVAIPVSRGPIRAGHELGAGREVSCQDTVPFVIWIVANFGEDFSEALWQTVAAGGDRDTTCAMVGGIVAAGCGVDGIPQEWRQAVEPLPDWIVA